MPLSGWNDKQKLILTINSSRIDGNLTDFPILILLSSGTGSTNYDAYKVFNDISYENRKKIAITDSNYNQLYTEVTYWNAVEKRAALWTKVPTISSGTNTILYLYYDSTQTTNSGYIGDTGETAAQNVWDSNFNLVHHMNEDPSYCDLRESSGNDNAPTYGTMTSLDLVEGPIDRAIDFDGTDDWADSPISMNLGNPSAQHTIEIITNGKGPFLSTERSSSSVGDVQAKINDSYNVQYIYDKSYTPPYTQTLTTTGTVSNTGPSYVGIVKNITANNHLIAINSVIEEFSETFVTQDTSYSDLEIARYRNYTYGTTYYNGGIGELRVSTTARTAAWLKATYYSLWDDLIVYTDAPRFYYSGYVRENSNPVVRNVKLYKRDTGEFVGSTWSAANGYYYIETSHSGTHFIVCLDDDAGVEYNDLILGNLYPDI